MAAHSSREQIKYMSDWFGNWSEFQKDDFVTILAQKLRPTQLVNGLVTGLQNMNCSSRPASLFTCQIKLFNDWWDSWNEEDRTNFQAKLREKDSKFWVELEGELAGTRKKLDEDFFLVSSNSMPTAEAGQGQALNTTTVTIAAADSTSVTVIATDGGNNGAGDSVTVNAEIVPIVSKGEVTVSNGSANNNGAIHSDESQVSESMDIPQPGEIGGEGDVHV